MSKNEDYLRAFHREQPRATLRGLGLGRTHDGRSSYDLLREAIASKGPVLDLGCGDGALLAGLGPDAVGVDLSPDDVGRAVGDRHRAVVARAQTLPFAESAFETVVSHLALMLMPVDAVLAEVQRVLRPGGQFAAMVQSDVPPTGAFLTFAQRMHAALEGTDVPQLGDPRISDRSAMDELLPTFGLRAARYEDATLHFAPGDRRVVFETLYGIDLVPPDRREHVLAAAEQPGACTVRVRLVTATRA